MRAIIGRLTVLLCMTVLVANVFGGIASADGCPKGMSQLDCDAIFGNWPNWIPDDGTTCGSSTGTDTLPGGDPKQQGFNYFVGKGLSEMDAAAIIGNFIVESSMSTSADQPNGPGLGIAQWSNPGRWTNPSDPTDTNTLTGFADSQGQSNYYSLPVQLDFVWHELQTTHASSLSNLKAQTTIEDATGYFMGTGSPIKQSDSATDAFIAAHGKVAGYEDPSVPHLDLRIKAAQLTLSSFGNGGSGGVSGGDAGCTGSGSVDCSSSAAPTDASSGALSQTRQQVVCLAQAQLALWTSGQMKSGFRKDSADSFSKYSQNSDELWCADFASWIYNQAGYPLGNPLSWIVRSVAGIKGVGELNDKFHYHAAGSYIPKPGDLLLHQTNDQDHVNIVVSVNANNQSMVVIGGDQPPTTSDGFPDGSVVSQYTDNGFDSAANDNITGYVSPD